MSTATFTNPGHTERILQKLWKNCDNEEMCDLVLIAGTEQKRIAAHRAVLSEASEYFNEILTSSLSESTSKDVKIPNVNSATLLSLIEYCYIGRVVISEDNAIELLKTADMLCLREVATACVNFMAAQLNPSNYLEFIHFAKQYHCELLLQKTKEYTRENFMEISKTAEFLQLNAEQLSQLLACNDLHVVSEEDVFNSLKAWLEHEPIEREQHKVELLKLVRMPLLERWFLVENVSPICTSLDCLRIYMKALELIVTADSSKPCGSNLTKPRKSCQFWMGLTNDKSNNKMFLHYYCPQRQKWTKCLKELEYREASAMVFMKNCLYIIGGFDVKNNILNSIICLNLNSMVLIEIPLIAEHTTNCVAAALNGFLYVVGGWNGSNSLASVEKWDPESKKWFKVASMAVGRWNSGVAVLNEKLYAVGGQSNGKILNSAECYDPVQDVWQNIAPMGESRELPRIAVASGLLYAVGGFGLKTAECYNPQTNKWTSICSLREVIFPCRSCITLHDKVIVSCKDRFEEYNAASNEWKKKESIKHPDNIYWIFSYSDKLLTSQFTET